MASLSIADYLLIFFLLILSTVFAGFRIAIQNLDRVSLDLLTSRNKLFAILISFSQDHERKFRSTLILGDILIKVFLTMLVTMHVVVSHGNNGSDLTYALLIYALVLVPLLLLFSESLPHTLAVKFPDKSFVVFSAPVLVLMVILKPIMWLVYNVYKLLDRLLGSDISRDDRVTEDQIMEVITAGEVAGAIEQEEMEMMHSIIKFGDTIVKEIMVPRVDMVCCEINTPIEKVLAVMSEKKFARIPIFENNIDSIAGIAYIKNIMNFWIHEVKKMAAVELIAMPYFVPETKRIIDLLREFQEEHIQMAIVVDEYGGTAGLITMEDIIEEIVGEIDDEFDVHEEMIQTLDDGKILIDSKVEVDEINELYNVKIPPGDYATVGGFLLWHLKHLPSKHDVIDFDSHKFIITKVDRKRIQKVILVLPSGNQTHNEIIAH